ncbi:MAG TPA: murein biosynthesis integral membrane protein MurJ [Burkholderiaceae bacterium]
MNLLKTMGAISSLTLLSRITGLLRESLFARAFGASAYTDAFLVAFRIPNLLRRLFAEGAFSQAFVPILSEYKNRKGEQESRQLVDHVATVLVWATAATALIGIVFTPAILLAIATGLVDKPATFDAAVFMTRVMFPYIAFMSFVALAGGVLNTWREFKVPAFTPVLLNVTFIVAALFVAPRMAEPIYVMAYAVIIGGVLQAVAQIPALIRIGMLPRIGNPITAMRDQGVRQVLRKMGPAVFAVSAAQISLMINTNIASHLATGSISWLSYADRLMEFPTAMLGVALGTILLPSLSKAKADDDPEEYSSLLDWGLRLTFLLALPAAVGMATLSQPLIAGLFHYGKFTAHTVAMSAQPLIAYSVGLIGIILVKILAPAFYARQDIRTPVRIAIVVLIATQLMNLVFVPQFAVAGLALSIGMGACLNAVMLYAGLRKRGIYTPHAGWLGFLLRLALALAAMAAVALYLSQRIDWIGMHAQPFLRFGLLLGVIAVCAAVYFAALLAMGMRPREFRRIAR